MERPTLYQRFKSLSWQHKLGNLASSLAAISAHSTVSQHDKLTHQLLREAALLIEWCAPDVPPDFLLELASLQRELMAWQQIFPLEAARSLLSLQARHRSERVLQMSGLLETDESLLIPLARQEL